MTLLERCQAIGKLNKDLAGTSVVDVSSSMSGCVGQRAALEAEYPEENFEIEDFRDGRCVVVWESMPEDIWDRVTEDAANASEGEPPEATAEQVEAAENEGGEASEESLAGEPPTD